MGTFGVDYRIIYGAAAIVYNILRTNLTILPDYTFLLELHCKDPCTLFRLVLYFKHHNLFTYRYTEYSIVLCGLYGVSSYCTMYMYLIEELFKDGIPPLSGPEREKKRQPIAIVPQTRKKTMFQRSAR